METASRRQSATTRVWGPIGSAEIFAEGTAYTATKRDVHRAGLDRCIQGVVGGCERAEPFPPAPGSDNAALQEGPVMPVGARARRPGQGRGAPSLLVAGIPFRV
jgi:hypothetical protein